MSKTKISLCSVLLKEHYGEIVQRVGTFLMMQVSSRPLNWIATNVSLPADKVRGALRVLIQHDYAEFCFSERGFVEYTVKTDRVLYMLHYPRYIYSAKVLYGDAAELLVEEILHNGSLTMSLAIKKVIERLQEATGADYTSKEVAEIREKFVALVEARYLCRCPYPHPGENKLMPSISISEAERYIIPEIKLYLLEKISSSEPTVKRQKREEQEFPDSGIYWKANNDRFQQYFRDKAIISAVSNNIDKKASEIVRTMLRLSEYRTDPWAPTTNPVAVHEIREALSKDANVEVKELDPYLGILTEGENSFLSKSDDRSGGMYVVNIKKCLQRLVEATVMSVVQDRFGSKSCRIFRLLLIKKYLEQKQLEDLAMIQHKDAKEYLYKMLKENFIFTQAIPKTPDHASSRTFFLFHVDINQVCRILLERCYQATFNAFVCCESQNKENKRLLEKKQRVDAIVATLQQSGAEEAQIEEVQEMITPPEKVLLDKVKNITDKLDRSQIQIAEMIILIQTWLQIILQ